MNRSDDRPYIRFVECPRDSWQGVPGFIPTDEKRGHLRALLDAGFRHLDLGSFVSAKAVPQMADTEEVLGPLERPGGADFLCIVANERGMDRALDVPNVTSVGYPLSVNDTFARRNTNRGVEESWRLARALLERAAAAPRPVRLVVYLSMGFGNPYGEPWEPGDTARAVERLAALGVTDVVLADTVGSADAGTVRAVLGALDDPAAVGLHLHARPDAWRETVDAALEAGVRWFEGALGGIGGCPFAGDELVGNLPTEGVAPYLASLGFDAGMDVRRLPELARRAARLRDLHAGSGERSG
jgi:hydroxymethylglutaryl-CoA lyase